MLKGLNQWEILQEPVIYRSRFSFCLLGQYVQGLQWARSPTGKVVILTSRLFVCGQWDETISKSGPMKSDYQSGRRVRTHTTRTDGKVTPGQLCCNIVFIPLQALEEQVRGGCRVSTPFLLLLEAGEGPRNDIIVTRQQKKENLFLC